MSLVQGDRHLPTSYFFISWIIHSSSAFFLWSGAFQCWNQCSSGTLTFWLFSKWRSYWWGNDYFLGYKQQTQGCISSYQPQNLSKHQLHFQPAIYEIWLYFCQFTKWLRRFINLFFEENEDQEIYFSKTEIELRPFYHCIVKHFLLLWVWLQEEGKNHSIIQWIFCWMFWADDWLISCPNWHICWWCSLRRKASSRWMLLCMFLPCGFGICSRHTFWIWIRSLL